MALQSPVADLYAEVLAGLDTTHQSLTAAILTDADLRSFSALVLDLLQPLRTTISKLGDDRCEPALSPQTGFSGLPPSIARETIAILDSCQRTLTAINLKTEEDILKSTSISPSSPESATLTKLQSFNDRLKIILDLRSLSSTDLLGIDSNAGSWIDSGVSSSSKADMLVAIARMRGLFASATPALDGPPTYDEAINGLGALDIEEKSKTGSSLSDLKSSRINKAPASCVGTMPRQHGEQSRTWSRNSELKATKLTTIQGKVGPGLDSNNDGPCRYFCGKEGGRLALTTSQAVELYEADTGALLWALEGGSQQFIRWHGQPVTFTRYFQFSPDGSILCVEVTLRWSHRELLVVGTQDGRVITRRALANNDGIVPHISPDNAKIALFQWSHGREGMNYIKVIPIDVESNEAYHARSVESRQIEHGSSMIPIPRLLRGGGISMSFTPDSKHVITCEGNQSRPGSNTDDAFLSTCVRIYKIVASGGALVHEVCIPGSRALRNPLFETLTNFAMRFHYPSPEAWLVSFSDFTDNVGKTRIVEATTGKTLALVAAERSTWQSWKSGILNPHMVEMAYDHESGFWTRIEVTKTVLPPGQTVTITRFMLPGAAWQQGNLKSIKDAWSVASSQVVVVNIRADETCDLSKDGNRLFVRRAAAQEVHVWAIH